ncbi:MAG: 16S rRNA (uracil(1498)-N(3))-methyltransferase [Verrucomicrobia bacterium]|nr:16S rRNA (uracil(1498)-N(3))-methyltransferase [Verrucomicrobiota bacterium]
MPENRFFLNSPFQKGKTKLDQEEFHHLKVMRSEVGEIIDLVNGKNQLAKAQIASLEKNSATLEILEIITAPAPPRQIILAQAYLRPKNLDLVIEKGTELGATAVWLFPGDRSEKDSLSDNQSHRLQTLTISALKQCGRLDLPSIIEMPPLSKWTHLPPGDLYFGDLHSHTPFRPTGDTTIFIGPEKGFSPKEEEWLRQRAKGVKLSPHILRAETAALCAVALANL